MKKNCFTLLIIFFSMTTQVYAASFTLKGNKSYSTGELTGISMSLGLNEFRLIGKGEFKGNKGVEMTCIVNSDANIGSGLDVKDAFILISSVLSNDLSRDKNTMTVECNTLGFSLDNGFNYSKGKRVFINSADNLLIEVGKN